MKLKKHFWSYTGHRKREEKEAMGFKNKILILSAGWLAIAIVKRGNFTERWESDKPYRSYVYVVTERRRMQRSRRKKIWKNKRNERTWYLENGQDSGEAMLEQPRLNLIAMATVEEREYFLISFKVFRILQFNLLHRHSRQILFHCISSILLNIALPPWKLRLAEYQALKKLSN